MTTKTMLVGLGLLLAVLALGAANMALTPSVLGQPWGPAAMMPGTVVGPGPGPMMPGHRHMWGRRGPMGSHRTPWMRPGDQGQAPNPTPGAPAPAPTAPSGS